MSAMASRTPTRHVVLLRGVNVGGYAKLPMAQLRDICAALGGTHVSTYIQSGNVILDSELTARALAGRLESAIDDAVGFTPRVLVRTPDDLASALAANPYQETPDNFLHIGFMDSAPAKDAVDALAQIDCSPEGFTVIGREIYLNYVEGAGRSKKLGKLAFERKLGVAITARNLRTVRKLVDLAEAKE
jgi:uncharacterized protein (DUF1697 family)